jgi:hypothetical protein
VWLHRKMRFVEVGDRLRRPLDRGGDALALVDGKRFLECRVRFIGSTKEPQHHIEAGGGRTESRYLCRGWSSTGTRMGTKAAPGGSSPA